MNVTRPNVHSLWALLLTVVIVSPVMAFSQSLYKTLSGTKYHLAECRMVNNATPARKNTPLARAKAPSKFPYTQTIFIKENEDGRR